MKMFNIPCLGRCSRGHPGCCSCPGTPVRRRREWPSRIRWSSSPRGCRGRWWRRRRRGSPWRPSPSCPHEWCGRTSSSSGWGPWCHHRRSRPWWGRSPWLTGATWSWYKRCWCEDDLTTWSPPLRRCWRCSWPGSPTRWWRAWYDNVINIDIGRYMIHICCFFFVRFITTTYTP